MDSIVNFTVIRDKDQMTLKLENWEVGVIVMVTLVFAKYTHLERISLWESLGDMAHSIQ